MRFLKVLKYSLFAAAALWSIYMRFYLYDLPMYNSYDGSGNVTRATLGEVNGSGPLLIFVFLFCAIAVLAIWERRPVLTVISAILSFSAAALAVLGMMSIGAAYFPSVLAVILGWGVIGIERRVRAKKSNTKSGVQS